MISFLYSSCSRWWMFNYQYPEPRSNLLKSAPVLRYLWSPIPRVFVLCTLNASGINMFCRILIFATKKYILYLGQLSALHQVKPFLLGYLCFQKSTKSNLCKISDRRLWNLSFTFYKLQLKSPHKNTLLPWI